MPKKDKGLSAWALTMLALGTVIGGSFFLGVAIPIKEAGPSIIVSYIIGGALVYFILFALSEMTVANPDPGSFRTYAGNAFGTGTAFITGWIYWTGLILGMSSESIAVSVFIRVWFPRVSIPVLGSIVIIVVTLANLLGADKLSKLESGLAAVKLLAIVGFIVIGIALIGGFMTGKQAIGLGSVKSEPLMPGGIGGIAGSMLIVMFAYAGFEIIGLASSETANPHKTVPRAIFLTVILLVSLYIISVIVLLPLIPTDKLTPDTSPFVAALQERGVGWAANAINVVLVTAILSTMLASTFGLGRMMRSLADEGHAPGFLKDKGDIPKRGILASGVAMLLGLALGYILPKQVYLFLVSSGSFSLLLTYLIIVASHYRFRKKNGCPPSGSCQLPGFPYTSWFAMATIVAIIASMPLVPGQGAGLIAGLVLLAVFFIVYIIMKSIRRRETNK